MFEAYILPIVIFTVLGVSAGALLTAASRLFAVKHDPRTEKIFDALPHYNCGACGYSGCEDYAKAVAEKGEKTNLCRPGGEDTAAALADIMNVTAETSEKCVAVVRCSADCGDKQKAFEFDGLPSCANVKRFYGGVWECKYSCLGFGDCVSVCPTGAVSVSDGLASVSADKCIGCGKCAEICPNNVIEIRKLKAAAAVICSSHDNGKKVRAVCGKGCIGCKLCEKQCGYGAVRVTDNLARVDADKCTACGKCAEKCPARVIRIFK